MGTRGRKQPGSFEAVLTSLFDVRDGAPWALALEAAASYVGAEALDFTLLDRSAAKVVEWHSARLDTEIVVRYTREYLNSNLGGVQPRVEIALGLSAGQMKADSDAWSSAERARMPFFQEFYSPMVKAADCLMGVARVGSIEEPCAILSPHFRTSPQAAQRERLARLLPHFARLQHGLEVSRRLLAENEALVLMLDEGNLPIALVDASGRIVRANRAAESLLSRGLPISLRENRTLRFRSEASMREFKAALDSCSVGLLDQFGQRAPFSRSVSIQDSLHPMVLTIRSISRALQYANEPVALLRFTALTQKLDSFSKTLEDAYGLSPTEAKLATAIAEGASIKAFASQHGITYETVRTYVRRILAKTAGQSQADIVRLARAHWE